MGLLCKNKFLCYGLPFEVNFNQVVLIYHQISTKKVQNKYIFQKNEFIEQLSLFKHFGMVSEIIDEYLNNALKQNGAYRKKIFITFDDGHESDYNIVMPALLENNFKATFFITSDWINTDGYLSKDQIRELSSHGMSIQSHAKTHRFLDEMSIFELHDELMSSKETIENIIGRDVSYLSVPGGRFNRVVLEVAEKVGYKAVCTSTPYRFQYSFGIYQIGRIGLREPIDEQKIKKLVCPTRYNALLLVNSYLAKRMAKKVIGNKMYYQIWKMLIKK